MRQSSRSCRTLDEVIRSGLPAFIVLIPHTIRTLSAQFEGWVSFHFPADAADGFCAFDVGGLVVIVAGETTTAELPVVRVDIRVQLDGG